MRERLTASFVLVVLVLLAGAALVRFVTVTGALRAEESEHLHEHLDVIASLVADRHEEGLPVDEGFLAEVVPDDTLLVYDDGSGPVEVTGSDYEDGDPDGDIEASEQVGSAELRLSQSDGVVRQLVAYDTGSVLILFGMIAVLAALSGYLISRVLSAPFRQLAGAAAALGRGRFDLDLPRTRIPEARAIGQALEASAAQIQDRLRREQHFAEHASHALRTPLTGLRLELEELMLHDELPEDARATLARALASADEVSRVAVELVDLNRRDSLMEGAQIPLRDLATQCTQHWADLLDERGRTVTAGVEGDLDLTYTPGPVEHVLDLVLADVLRHSRGSVRLVFDGDTGDHLRVKIVCEAAKHRPWWPAMEDPDAPDVNGSTGPLVQAGRVIEAVGGRLQRHPERGELELLLPRR